MSLNPLVTEVSTVEKDPMFSNYEYSFVASHHESGMRYTGIWPVIDSLKLAPNLPREFCLINTGSIF